jgi:hypothetical protein
VFVQQINATHMRYDAPGCEMYIRQAAKYEAERIKGQNETNKNNP